MRHAVLQIAVALFLLDARIGASEHYDNVHLLCQSFGSVLRVLRKQKNACVALDSGSCDLCLFGTVSAKTKRRAIPQVVSCIQIDRFVAAQGSGSQSCLGKAKI